MNAFLYVVIFVVFSAIVLGAWGLHPALGIIAAILLFGS